MSARAPYFLVREIPARKGGIGSGFSAQFSAAYWLVDFRSGNHANVFNGQRWHSKRAALHAIALIDPTGQHPVVLR